MRKTVVIVVASLVITSIGWAVFSPFMQPGFKYNLLEERQGESPSALIESLASEPEELLPLIKDQNHKRLLQVSEKTPWSICYVHGFTASPMELSPVVEEIAQELGANLFLTRLSGHGLKDSEPMGQVKAQDWINDALECLTVAQSLGEKTLLMGTSFGGTLSTLVTLNAPQPPDALVLVSPNFGIKDKASFLLGGALGKTLTKILFGTHREFKAENELHGYHWTTRHPASALQEFMKATLALKKQDYNRLKAPTLIAYSPEDEVLDVEEIRKFYAKIKPQVKLLISEPEWDQHVLAGDIVNPKGNRALKFYVIDFLNKNL